MALNQAIFYYLITSGIFPQSSFNYQPDLTMLLLLSAILLLKLNEKYKLPVGLSLKLWSSNPPSKYLDSYLFFKPRLFLFLEGILGGLSYLESNQLQRGSVLGIKYWKTGVFFQGEEAPTVPF